MIEYIQMSKKFNIDEYFKIHYNETNENTLKFISMWYI